MTSLYERIKAVDILDRATSVNGWRLISYHQFTTFDWRNSPGLQDEHLPGNNYHKWITHPRTSRIVIAILIYQRHKPIDSINLLGS
jgi:hypothetical protein